MLVTGKAEFRRVNDTYYFKDNDGKEHVYNSMEIEDDFGRITVTIPEDAMDIAKKLERGKFYNFQLDLREFRGKKKVYFVGIA